MYIWRKWATADWIRGHEEMLVAVPVGAVAIIERPGKPRKLVEVSCVKKDQARNLQREFGGFLEKLPRNWLQKLTKSGPAKPLRIGSRLIVGRTSNRPSNGTRTIVIPAETAFGTGDHATTAMCLRILERATRNWAKNWTMLDAGTGSGILAIAASCFGAKRVIAIDNDPRACAIAKRNARQNGIRNVTVQCGDVLKLKTDDRFNVIAGNLFSEILIAALPGWSRQLANEGWLILSGILREQERSLAQALRKNGFFPSEIKRRGKWIAIVAASARKKS